MTSIRLTQKALFLAVVLGVLSWNTTVKLSTTSCPCTVWSDSTVPAQPDSSDEQPVEVGVRFRSNVPGSMTGLRFYKSLLNVGPHVGDLWSSDGTLLSTVTFASETESGWQQVSLPSPVALVAGVAYTASYHTDAGHYAVDAGAFSSAGVDSGPLHVLRSGEDGRGNGVLAYGSGGVLPTVSGDGSNFWVDVVFAVDAPTISSFSPTKAPTGTQVTINGSSFTGATGVAFGGIPGAFTVTSGTQIRATVPVEAVTGAVTVTTWGGSASGGTFSVMPKVTSLDPLNGPVGAPVTIRGSGLAGTYRVKFPGAPAQFTVIDSQTVTTTVPEFATSGQIRLSTPVATTLTPSFTVVTSDPLPGDYRCTRVLGFSQTANWFNDGGFQNYVPNAKWEGQVPGGGHISAWADPNSTVWSSKISSPCVQGPPDRVLLTIGLKGTATGIDGWIRDAITNIHTKLPSVGLIILQPVVGGPGHAVCYLSGQVVRASVDHPVVDDAITRAVGGEVVTGASPEVSQCTQYRDNLGHLTPDGSKYVGGVLGQFYADYTAPSPSPSP